MKSAGRVTLVFLLCAVVVGCGSAEEEKSSESGLAHPKHPDVRVEVRDPSGSSRHSIWYEDVDGCIFHGHQSSGEGVNCSLKYDGTTDAGDEYTFDVRQGETEKSKTFVYEGEEMTVDLGDGVSITLKPRS